MVPVVEPETLAERLTAKGATPELGIAERLTERDAPPTFTVTLSLAEPPGPVQVIVKAVEAIRLRVGCEPLEGHVPPQAPEAVQLVVLEEVQERVTEVL